MTEKSRELMGEQDQQEPRIDSFDDFMQYISGLNTEENDSREIYQTRIHSVGAMSEENRKIEIAEAREELLVNLKRISELRKNALEKFGK